MGKPLLTSVMPCEMALFKLPRVLSSATLSVTVCVLLASSTTESVNGVTVPPLALTRWPVLLSSSVGALLVLVMRKTLATATVTGVTPLAAGNPWLACTCIIKVLLVSPGSTPAVGL